MEDEKNLKEIPESALEGVSAGAETFKSGEKAIVDGSIHVFILILDKNVQFLSRRHRLTALPNM